MKWKETQVLAPGSPLTRIGSGRRAILVNIHDLVQRITVRYLDDKHIEERCLPSEFDVGWKAPAGTVARGSQ